MTNRFDRNTSSIREKFRKPSLLVSALMGISLGAIIVVGSWEIVFVPATGYWTPVKQIKYLDAIAKREQKGKEEYRAQFNSLYSQFIQLADRDNNGYLDFAEQVDAWKRMGQEGPFFESRGAQQFLEPTIEGIKKAIESYKSN